MRKLAGVLLVLALVACSGGDEEVARVGDSVIRRSDVEALFDGGAPSDDVFREMLFSKMAVEVLDQALAARYGVTADATQTEEYATQLEQALAERGSTPAEYLGVADASNQMLRLHARVLSVQEATLRQLLADPEVVDGLFADPATVTNVCVKHILVATEEEADVVKTRLAAGEDFAAVADEVSLDTNTEGGDLGCAYAGDYVAEFAEAALAATLGEVTGPVQSQYGFHVLVVSERTVPTREEFLADPWGLLSEGQLSRVWADWMAEALNEADPWVAPKYGTWTPTGIDAPGAETTTTG